MSNPDMEQLIRDAVTGAVSAENTGVVRETLEVVLACKVHAGADPAQWRMNLRHAIAALKPAPRKIVRYVNVYRNGSGSAYKTRADADINSLPGRAACIRVEAEEGRYDD